MRGKYGKAFDEKEKREEMEKKAIENGEVN